MKAKHILPVVMLVLALLITFLLVRDARRVSEKYLQDEFAFRVQEINEAIYRRMQLYEQVLRGTQGLFAASGAVSREEFRSYIDTLDLQRNYPGIEGIGFSLVVSPAAKPGHIQEMRRSGFPQYVIKPAGERDLYTSILYLEPFSGRNLHAFGFDMYSEARRREAMEKSRDSNQAVMSKKTRLVQEVEVNVQVGFLMYLPVYRSGSPHETVEQRRENLIGWVYAPFRMNDLMRGMEGVRTGELDVEIYDGGKLDDAGLMYDSNQVVSAIRHPGRFTQVEPLQFASHQWLVAITSLALYERQADDGRAGLLLRGGISISLLLSMLAWVFLDDKARALQAADQAMQLALYDALTGLPNRKLLSERLALALSKAKRDHGKVALLFIDLDKFKPVNDEYGHAIGDLLLKDVGRRLQHCMRESDTVGRIGGDEFVAMLGTVEGREGACKAADKILRELTRPFEVVGHRLEIGGSIGVALYPEHGEEPNALLKSADMAMYEAKNSGRGTVRFAS
ncbi:diguanylate cyclase [Janthinobacterium sp. 17J80-10]|nr:diguanylate cyclase [Janthinobacterium sp. 17J80-10]